MLNPNQFILNPGSQGSLPAVGSRAGGGEVLQAPVRFPGAGGGAGLAGLGDRQQLLGKLGDRQQLLLGDRQQLLGKLGDRQQLLGDRQQQQQLGDRQQLLGKLQERKLILDAFSLENPR